MPPRQIIFDCDGVLVDSEPLSMRIDVEILAEAGVTMGEDEAHARFVGKTFAAMIEEVSQQFGVSFPAGVSADKDRRLLDLYSRELKPVAGLRATLEGIGRMDYGIASNSPEDRVRASIAITGLAPWFQGPITTFEHVARGKPAPDIFIEAARRAGTAPEHCLVIEDSVTGVTAAVAAGCQVLGFVGVHPDREGQSRKVVEAGAKLAFSDMRDLPGLFDPFLSEA
jgi:HAD superfamily hydrolase (TIGR01509 family)